MDNIKKIIDCPITGDTNSFVYLDLGNMPIVNTLCDSKESSLDCEKYPLKIQLFTKSKLSSLTNIIDPNILFSNYSYVSGVSLPYIEHCKEMFHFLNSYVSLKEGDSVLDIGGNDGILLNTFLKEKSNISVLNIDASSNICEISNKNGIPAINEFWNVETAKKINRKFKLIISTNVFQHNENIKDFVEGISISLEKFGIWCLEFPYWKINMETNQYDQIYHEHVYYYLVQPLQKLFDKFNLRIIKAVKYPIHGGSMRLLISHKGKIGEAWQPCDSVENIIKKENDITEDYYKNWGKEIKKHIDSYKKFLLDIRKEGSEIVGFGAAAKGCIFLNSAKITCDLLSVVVDDTNLKQGKFIPGTGIQIVNRDYFFKNKVDYVLILAHNFKEEIIKSLKENQQYKGKFIVLFPEPKII